MGDNNPLIEMMKRIRFDIFDRLEKGTLNYKRDTATLQKHLELAQEMNDQKLMGQTHNMLGIVNSRMGHIDKAEMHYLQAIGIIEQTTAFELLGSLYNNLGELYRRTGRFDLALQNYERSRQQHEKSEKPIGIITVENNIGLAAVALKDYGRAKTHFERVLEMTKVAPWDHVEAIIETSNGLAEVKLHGGDILAAWMYADNAERMASERNLRVSLALTHLTKAHIAESDPDRKEEARQFYTQARQGIRTHGTPLFLARTLMDEARYQERHGHREETRRLASEALEMFKSMEMENEIKLAQDLLLSVEAV